jgi:hypothetical protein
MALDGVPVGDGWWVAVTVTGPAGERRGWRNGGPGDEPPSGPSSGRRPAAARGVTLVELVVVLTIDRPGGVDRQHAGHARGRRPAGHSAAA